MGAIAESRLILLKGLVKTLPQSALRSLELALGLTRDAPLVEVRELISLELEFRHVKEAVFEPFMALFQPRTDGLSGVLFEPWILNNIWAALETREAELYQQARYALRGLRTEDPVPVVFFRLVTAACAICRDAPEEILRRNAAPADRATVVEFGYYLELHRIARTVLHRLPDYMSRIDAEKAAALRLMYRDASAFNDESGNRLLEIMFANLEDGAQIIKFVATVSDRPKDRFLAESELADFGERILALIESRLRDLRGFMGSRHRPCEDIGSAGARVSQSLAQMQSFEQYIELSRDGPWGKRIAEAHRQIAEMVEAQLKQAEKMIEDALPMKSERLYGRIKKDVPALDQPVSPAVLDRAKGMLSFIRALRPTASAGGYASLQAKTAQLIELHMDSYFDDLLGIANGEDPFDPDVLMAAFEVVTDLMEVLCGDEKAHVGRRRVASSDIYKPRANVA